MEIVKNVKTAPLKNLLLTTITFKHKLILHTCALFKIVSKHSVIFPSCAASSIS